MEELRKEIDKTLASLRENLQRQRAVLAELNALCEPTFTAPITAYKVWLTHYYDDFGGGSGEDILEEYYTISYAKAKAKFEEWKQCVPSVYVDYAQDKEYAKARLPEAKVYDTANCYVIGDVTWHAAGVEISPIILDN